MGIVESIWQSWDDLLLAFLHEPPDKALDVRGQAQRASRYASEAVGRTISAATMEGLSDLLATLVEHVSLPSAGEHGPCNVEPRHGRLTIFHPLSGERSNLAVEQADEATLRRVISELVSGLDSPRDRFLAVWRLLPERLAAVWPWSALLPADARLPDHSIWHHLDAATALRAASGPHGAALFWLDIGPAETLAQTARSVRDLRSGTSLLSWLAFQAMLPLVEQLGPAAILYPSLRGNPLLDHWLRQNTQIGHKLKSLRDSDKDTNPKRERGAENSSSFTLRVSTHTSLPNRFLAIVPWGGKGQTAHELAEQCRMSARRAWMQLATAVHDRLDHKFRPLAADWDKRWKEQIENFLAIRTATLPLDGPRGEIERELAALWGKSRFAEAFPQATNVRGLADAIPDSECPASLKRSNPARANSGGLWQVQVELAARLLECQQGVCHFPPPTAHGGTTPPKCSLLGTYEQMGPDNLKESRDFWEQAAKSLSGGSPDGCVLHDGERLCAAALIRRFAEVFFAKEFGMDDVLMSPEPELPRHFAVLAMDGDDLGGWLRGEYSPPLRDVLHPDLRDYFAARDGAAAGLAAPRPVGPALHTAINEAQTNFALHVAPRIVQRHGGQLICSNGGNLLALLRASAAVACAHELRLAYSGDPRVNGGARSGYYRHGNRDLLVMGARATASAGLAVVQDNEDLRLALAAARKALEAAKDAGGNALYIAACQRSSEQTVAQCPWEFADTVQSWVDAFAAGADDRWLGSLREELPTLAALGDDFVLAELRRHIRPNDPTARDALPSDQMATALDSYRRSASGTRSVPDAWTNFLSLGQIASLLARKDR
jgi:CRISPR-associated protein Cmr2